ncbi:MAG: class II D-tagatose-bisphosphate aldolase, non-catalytic subunit [Desulfobacteraceae bacterium]|nr:class II D-tagatose-bisphosphate aldolase, non-catalytic subunit [Desulfobacteraceae bacterium]
MRNSLYTLRKRHLNGSIGGMFAICSVHPAVLSVAINYACGFSEPLLIETTPNQVNLSGGYSAMTPESFVSFINELARSKGFDTGRIILGADHLGPHLWKNQPADKAMAMAVDLIRKFAQAGYHKFHLDTAVVCADDPDNELDLETVARRAAILCRACEEQTSHRPEKDRPLYVIGQDVPLAGGGLDNGGKIQITSRENLFETLNEYRRAFTKAGLEPAWQRVMAVVVQPGIDFGDETVITYRHRLTEGLRACHADLPGIMTYETHATDYQLPDAIAAMVKDHFLILKAGPCLTFAFRKAVYALAHIEQALPDVSMASDLYQVLDDLMIKNPRYLPRHYQDNSPKARYLRHYSYLDRLRYYWSQARAQRSLNQLRNNLNRPLPKSLLKHYLPEIFPDIENGKIEPKPDIIVANYVEKALKPYFQACWS